MEMKDIKVEEFTSPVVISIRSTESLDKAMDLMQEHNIRHLPVVDEVEVIGVISERDVLTHQGKGWDKMMSVSDIMNTSILSVHVDDNLGEVAYQLSLQKKGSAIVLDESNKLFGIFTTTDALNALVDLFYPLAKGKSEFKNL